QFAVPLGRFPAGMTRLLPHLRDRVAILFDLLHKFPRVFDQRDRIPALGLSKRPDARWVEMNDPRQKTLRDAQAFRDSGLRFPVRYPIPDAFPAARRLDVGVELGFYRLPWHPILLGNPGRTVGRTVGLRLVVARVRLCYSDSLVLRAGQADT